MNVTATAQAVGGVGLLYSFFESTRAQLQEPVACAVNATQLEWLVAAVRELQQHYQNKTTLY